MRTAALAALITFGLDQITKIAVVQGLNLKERAEIDVLPPYLNFRMAWNQGVNFGLFSGPADVTRWLIIIVSVIIAVWVWIWVRRSRPGFWAQLSAGLLIGGALGNVIDRLWYGAVADFLNMSCCGFENPYSFNVADITIFAGAFGLVLFTGQAKDGPKGGTPSAKRGKPDRKTP